MTYSHFKDLLLPSAYQEPTATVNLVQTHISLIFITDNFVYKIKKPVDFGFLNFSTLDRRRFYCAEEVRLNRRLCPNMYLGVVEVRETPDGCTFAGEGKIIDYAVKMRRLPEERMLNRLLDNNQVTEQDIRCIARTIAGFHLACERGKEIDLYGSPDAILRNWNENFAQSEAFVGFTISAAEFELLRGWVNSFQAANLQLFEERVAGGFIRDCDGDIHSENICLADTVYIFDCIEFNNRFRYSDTTADIAFLLMDFDFHRKAEFAEPFLEEYLKVTGDQGIVSLIDYYKTYRAFVRGKVESFRLNDPQISPVEKSLASDKARRYFRLAGGYVRRRLLPPSLIITWGLTGTGKSHIVEELAFVLGLDIHASDPVRKELAGMILTERHLDSYAEGIYTAEHTKATYSTLLQRAESSLAMGKSVIVDATFCSKSNREAFRRLANRADARFLIIAVNCPPETVKARLAERQLKDGEVSDGRWEIYLKQSADCEALTDNEGEILEINTENPPNDNLNRLLDLLCGQN